MTQPEHLPPGRELDRACAVKMGLRIYNAETETGVNIDGKYASDFNENYPHFTEHVPTEWNPDPLIYWERKSQGGLSWTPSEDINIAFILVDFALAKGCGFVLKKEVFPGCYWWDCDFSLAHFFSAREDTRCHAIAQAFLNIDFDDKFPPRVEE